VTYDGLLDALAHLYANQRDLRDALLSPIYGDFGGFPPTFLVSGTRDLFLSNTIRAQRKLQAQRIPTTLVIEEGQSHGQFLFAALTGAPEANVLYQQFGSFFDHYLDR
jgi:epsilon-lactone hydrolase